jgi:hypothetical protein
MKQIIHINQHHIKWNRKNPDEEPKPVITCKTYKDNQYHHGIDLVDNQGNIIGSVRYQPENPLACGAHVWIEVNTDTITVVPQEESQ